MLAPPLASDRLIDGTLMSHIIDAYATGPETLIDEPAG